VLQTTKTRLFATTRHYFDAKEQDAQKAGTGQDASATPNIRPAGWRGREVRFGVIRYRVEPKARSGHVRDTDKSGSKLNSTQ
jgi:hypothetical protein